MTRSTSIARQLADRAAIVRHASYAERVLCRALAGVLTDGWHLEVAADPRGVRAELHRGELRIAHGVGRERWWEPVTRAHAEQVVRPLRVQLARWWRVYREADETGRLRVTLWRGSRKWSFQPMPGFEAVHVVLEPGWRAAELIDPVLYRFDQEGPIGVEQGLRRGVVREGAS